MQEKELMKDRVTGRRDEQKSGWTDVLKRDVQGRFDQTDRRELPEVHHYTF